MGWRKIQSGSLRSGPPEGATSSSSKKAGSCKPSFTNSRHCSRGALSPRSPGAPTERRGYSAKRICASVRTPRRDDQVHEGAEDDSALEGEVPVFEIFDVARDPVLDIGAVARFAAKSTDLGQAGDAGLHERADVIVRHQL